MEKTTGGDDAVRFGTLHRLENRLIFLILMVLMFCSCRRDHAVTEEGDVQKHEIPDQEMWNSTVTVTHKGQVEAILQYGHLARYSEERLIKFDSGVVVDFFDRGEHASRLTADSGEMREESNDVRAMGNVVVISDSGLTLFTEELAYLQRLNKILTEKSVKITTDKGDTLYGVGFESDPNLRVWHIKNPRGKAHKGADRSEVMTRRQRARADSIDVSQKASGSDTLHY